MTHTAHLGKGKQSQPNRERVPKDPVHYSHDQVGKDDSYVAPWCMHRHSVECYAAQVVVVVFFFGSDFEPKLMPKEMNQIAKPQLGSWETPPVSYVSTEDQHCPRGKRCRIAMFGINAGRPLPDVTPKREDSLTVVEDVQSRLFQKTAAASAIGHVCQARFESSAGEG